MIRDLATHSDLPWQLERDINEIFYNFEKRGGMVRNQRFLDSFYEASEDCGLHDLGFLGYEFTWENKRGIAEW